MIETSSRPGNYSVSGEGVPLPHSEKISYKYILSKHEVTVTLSYLG